MHPVSKSLFFPTDHCSEPTQPFLTALQKDIDLLEQKVIPEETRAQVYLHARSAPEGSMSERHSKKRDELVALAAKLEECKISLTQKRRSLPYLDDPQKASECWSKLATWEIRRHLLENIAQKLLLIYQSDDYETALTSCKQKITTCRTGKQQQKVEQLFQEAKREFDSHLEQITYKDSRIVTAIKSLYSDTLFLLQSQNAPSAKTVEDAAPPDMDVQQYRNACKNVAVSSKYTFKPSSWTIVGYYKELSLIANKFQEDLAKSLSQIEKDQQDLIQNLFSTQEPSYDSSFYQKLFGALEKDYDSLKKSLSTLSNIDEVQTGLHYASTLYAWMQELKYTDTFLQELTTDKTTACLIQAHRKLLHYLNPAIGSVISASPTLKIGLLSDFAICVKSLLNSQPRDPFLAEWNHTTSTSIKQALAYSGPLFLTLTTEEEDLYKKCLFKHPLSSQLPQNHVIETLKRILLKFAVSALCTGKNTHPQLDLLFFTLGTHMPYKGYFEALEKNKEFITSLSGAYALKPHSSPPLDTFSKMACFLEKITPETLRIPHFAFMIWSACLHLQATSQQDDQQHTSYLAVMPCTLESLKPHIPQTLWEIEPSSLDTLPPKGRSLTEKEWFALLLQATYGNKENARQATMSALQHVGRPSTPELLVLLERFFVLELLRTDSLKGIEPIKHFFTNYVKQEDNTAQLHQTLYGICFMERALYKYFTFIPSATLATFKLLVPHRPLQHYNLWAAIMRQYSEFCLAQDKENKQSYLESAKSLYDPHKASLANTFYSSIFENVIAHMSNTLL